MIVKKSMINSINKMYIHLIKEFYYTQEFNREEKEILVCTEKIYDKKVDFFFVFKKIHNAAYITRAFYHQTQLKGKYRISIHLNVSDYFSELEFKDLNLRIKALLIHEIEHHLQNRKFPFREKLPRKDYTNTIDYLSNKSEIEAITKHLYSIHRKNKTNLQRIRVGATGIRQQRGWLLPIIRVNRAQQHMFHHIKICQTQLDTQALFQAGVFQNITRQNVVASASACA